MREGSKANGGPGQESTALAALYGIVRNASSGSPPETIAAGVLEVFSSRLSMTRGAVVLPGAPGTSPAPVAVHGMSGEECLVHFSPNRRELGRLLPGEVLLLRRRGAPVLVKEDRGPRSGPARGDIAFFCAMVPGNGRARPVIAADTLFGEEVDPAEDARLLTTAALVLSSYLGCPREGGGGGKDRGTPLGRVLQRHIRAWIEPMQTTRRIARSDVYDRLIGEVEKILIAAALSKTGNVQTEAARFLGINRNTLSRKIRRHGLDREGEAS